MTIKNNTVVIIKGEAEGIVKGYEKGWYAVETKDGVAKVREKDLEVVEGNSVVRLNPDHSRYIRGLGTTPSGGSTYDTDDEAARTLRDKSLAEQYGIVAEKLGIDVNELMDQYSHLNNGMQRMNLGNRLRKALSGGVATKKFSDKTMTIDDKHDREEGERILRELEDSIAAQKAGEESGE